MNKNTAIFRAAFLVYVFLAVRQLHQRLTGEIDLERGLNSVDRQSWKLRLTLPLREAWPEGERIIPPAPLLHHLDASLGMW